MNFLSALLNSLPGAAAQGLIWGLMAIGVYITFRILDVADLTVDGSIATGGAAAVMLIRAGMNPWLALLRVRMRHAGWLCDRNVPYQMRHSCNSVRHSHAACTLFY